ncbi:DnaB Replicative DNA helicase [uncultured Caudovirales phage]|uniref:DNA 5'-3' helicase n=1 Tax=uncultured Caudovirales phage TaxID=2100421 RepID=A0A6J7WA38_9CAUD|nr:DnaB Replicative DNA helicase [uncultured Caudovirales phage]
MDNSIRAYEANLLGALMSPGFDATDACESLKPQWFSVERHRHIYSAWLDLRQKGFCTDIVSVHDALTVKLGNQQSLLGDLAEMSQYALHGESSVRNNIRAIRNNGKKLELKSKLIEALHNVDASDSYDMAIAGAASALDESIASGSERGIVTASEIAQMGLAFVQDRIDGKFEGLKTGIDELDELMFGGLRGGELVTLFGPPKGGKTTAATTFLENIALSNARPVILVFSREMGEVQLAVRHFASLGGASARNLLTGHITDEDYDGIAAAVGRISDLNIVYDLDSNTPSQIALKVAQVKRKYGKIDLVMVDHIGLVASDKQRKSRAEEVTDITWALKTLAKKQNVPVLMIAQQNRNYSARKDKTPMLADLAESSSIEKDSDILIGVLAHRDGELRGWTELHVVGARMGEIGVAVAQFGGNRLRNGSREEFVGLKARAGQASGGKYFGDIE